MTDTPAEVAEELLVGAIAYFNGLNTTASRHMAQAIGDCLARNVELERQLAVLQSQLYDARTANDELLSQLAAQRERDGRDAERLDFIAPGFKVLAGDHVLQVWWMAGKQSRVASVPVNTPDAVRAAIDAALKGRP
jgi:hypothetical protein